MVRQMIRSKPWLFKLDQDFTFDAANFIATDINFENSWLKITNGMITVNAGYCWDGCSYKLSIADLCVIGTPDGRLHHGLPITYHASLIHDALVQFRHSHPLKQQQATAIFNGMLKERQFCWRKLYVFAVALFGPSDFKGNKQTPAAS